VISHSLKVKSTGTAWHLYSAFTESGTPQSARVWHMLTMDHTVLPVTHTRVHKWNESCLFLLSAAEHHRIWAGTHFRPAEGRRLSWHGWLVTYLGSLPAEDGHPSQY